MPTKRQLLSVISHTYPEIAWTKARHIGNWWSNDIIILDERFIFRFPKNEWGMANLKREVALLRVLSVTVSIAVPKYDLVGTNGEFWGYSAIPGRTLRRVDLRNRSLRKRIAEQIGEFLSGLHSVDISSFSNFEPASSHYSLSQGYLRYVASEFRSVSENMNPDLLDKTVKCLELLASLPVSYSAMTHYDFQGKNMLFCSEEQKLSWIIDFTDAGIFDPAVDFSHLLGFGESFVKEILSFYPCEFGDVFERAKFYRARNFIFAFPECLKKYPKRRGSLEKRLQESVRELKEGA